MLSLRKPTAESIRQFLAVQRALPFSYAEVGATATAPPAGYDVDRTHAQLGHGEAVFRRAKQALARWQQFRLGWVEAWPADTPIREGEVVAVLGRAVGLWWLNACRIVYVVDEIEPCEQFGFGYGTLPGHVERGEERFTVAWDRATDRVTFDIVAFSRPHHPLTRLGYPLVRRAQKRFGRQSVQAMRVAVGATT